MVPKSARLSYGSAFSSGGCPRQQLVSCDSLAGYLSAIFGWQQVSLAASPLQSQPYLPFKEFQHQNALCLKIRDRQSDRQFMIPRQFLVLAPPWPFASRLQLKAAKRAGAAGQSASSAHRGVGGSPNFGKTQKTIELKFCKKTTIYFFRLFQNLLLEHFLWTLDPKKRCRLEYFFMSLTLFSGNMSSLHLTESPTRSASD